MDVSRFIVITMLRTMLICALTEVWLAIFLPDSLSFGRFGVFRAHFLSRNAAAKNRLLRESPQAPPFCDCLPSTRTSALCWSQVASCWGTQVRLPHWWFSAKLMVAYDVMAMNAPKKIAASSSAARSGMVVRVPKAHAMAQAKTRQLTKLAASTALTLDMGSAKQDKTNSVAAV